MQKKVEKLDLKSKILRIVYILAAIAVPVMLLVFGGGSSFSTPNNYEKYELSEGWRIYYRGRIVKNAALDDFEADGVVMGERAAFEIELPDVKLFSPCLVFKTRMSRVRVLDDGREIYSFGYDIADGSFVPKTYNYVQLPEVFAGHTIRIEITAAEDSAFSGVYPVTLGNTEDLMRHFVQSRRLNILIGVFMFYFGCILAVLSPFLILGTAKDSSVFFSAMISLFLGIYILCYNDVMAYFTHNYTMAHVLEYISLYISPCVVTCYILTSDVVRKRRGVLYGILTLNVLFAFVAVLFHYTRILMINYFLVPFHVMVFFESMYLIYMLVRSEIESRGDRKNRVGVNTEVLILLGLMFFVISVFLEMIKYYLFSYILKLDRADSIDFVTLGALAVVLSMMLNYFFHSIDHLTEARTRIKLHGMAFTDALTGIDNRASCDQFMAGLEGSGQGYALVSIDLDGLKAVNDKQGHSIGDLMISGFGELLRDAFSDCELVGRMGGDEFIVIKKGIGAAGIETDLRSLSLGVAEANRRGGTFKYAYSYGTADSTEREDVKSVYMLADKRMYEMKDEHHKRRGQVNA